MGAFAAAFLGSAIFGFLVNGLDRSRAQSDTKIFQALIAIPGALIGLALSYWYGARMDRETRHRPRPDESRRALAARSVRLASQYQWDAVQAVSLAERPL